jgi:hypothetical protein
MHLWNVEEAAIVGAEDNVPKRPKVKYPTVLVLVPSRQSPLLRAVKQFVDLPGMQNLYAVVLSTNVIELGNLGKITKSCIQAK